VKFLVPPDQFFESMIYAMGVTERMKELHPAATVRKVMIDIPELKRQWNEQKALCFWSGLSLNPVYNKISNHPWAVSIDRLQSHLEYVAGNVVFTRRMFNLGRGKFPPDAFGRLMRQTLMVIQYRKTTEEPNLFDA
jgi:hypothetical protein